MKGFSIGELVKFGWVTFKNHWVFLLGIAILSLILIGAPSLLSNVLEDYPPTASVISANFLLILLYIFAEAVVGSGYINICLKYAHGLDAGFKDFFNSFSVVFKYFIVKFLFGLIVFAGLILLIFPAFIWGARYCLAPYFVVEKGLGPIDALKASARATYGAKWDLFGLLIVSVFISLIGILCLVIGMFATVPITTIALAVAYRKLTSHIETTELIGPT